MDVLDPLLDITEHRPWALPREPWSMEQVWDDLLFLHWPVSVELMRPLVPGKLQLDTREGTAWITITPMYIRGLRPRNLRAVPVLSQFLELNLRTYVIYEDRPGVFFFSLDAANLSAVIGARFGYMLPYFHARMTASWRDDWRHFESSRRVFSKAPADFRARYRPVSDPSQALDDSIPRWLAERYCLYTVVAGHVYRAEIHHAAWPLQKAEGEIEGNTLARGLGIELPTEPHSARFSKRLRVLVWPLHRVG